MKLSTIPSITVLISLAAATFLAVTGFRHQLPTCVTASFPPFVNGTFTVPDSTCAPLPYRKHGEKIDLWSNGRFNKTDLGGIGCTNQALDLPPSTCQE